jgi:hypothetical protein
MHTAGFCSALFAPELSYVSGDTFPGTYIYNATTGELKVNRSTWNQTVTLPPFVDSGRTVILTQVAGEQAMQDDVSYTIQRNSLSPQ